ncbi:MAG: hypothetical protein C5B60_02120 [Chloroflexi bacterium]|nr:MAG: hypothetical protein C5B60_02120 [Chloroflexota bacterium]
MPNVVGKPLGQAILTIQGAGLSAAPVAQVDPQVPPGNVIRTSPPGGTTVPSTQVVTVYYSAPQPTATPPQIAVATNVATAIATPVAGPEGACATPTPTPAQSVATPPETPTLFQTPTPAPPETPTPSPTP